jgi:hypothetical protein
LVRATEAISGNLHSEGDNIELEEMLLNELTESASVIQKQSEEAKEKKTQQKSVLAAACASSQAEFVGVIDNLVPSNHFYIFNFCYCYYYLPVYCEGAIGKCAG